MEVVPYRRRGRFIVPTADSSAIRTTPIHRPKHGGGKPRHYYTRTGGSRRHIVVAGLAPAMLSLSTLQGERHHQGETLVMGIPSALATPPIKTTLRLAD